MWPNPREIADLVTFAKEILNEKFNILCSVFHNFENKIIDVTKILETYNSL